jgi:hypothetical protein
LSGLDFSLEFFIGYNLQTIDFKGIERRIDYYIEDNIDKASEKVK